MPERDHVIREWYSRYEQVNGKNRNDLLRNPGVLFQALSYWTSIIYAIRSININREFSMILDVGCGNGVNTEIFIKLGFDPINIYGIDIQKNRIQDALRKYPSVKFQVGDASKIAFKNESFDLVCESTMFMQINDDNLATEIAQQMIRVTKRKGYIFLADWRYNKIGKSEYKALSKKRLTKIFNLGNNCILTDTFKGSLVPPIGRLLSSKIPFFYFFFQTLFPFLVGQVTYVLQKQ